jgi:ABC-type polysaccharide/polyol phosphate transport system ATPase subunit
MPALEFDNVTKAFSLHKGRALLATHIKQAFGGAVDRTNALLALQDVSFRVEEGESVCLIGHNGAGKSTVLSLVAGLSPPDGGRVEVHGRVAALLELGSGFHPDLTGEENAELNAALLGLSRDEVRAAMPKIVEFSGLGGFVQEPMRTYSNGMIMRLAFAVAAHVEPDILLIDEVLAVGDRQFRAKCVETIHGFRRRGKTMLTVSHDQDLLRGLVDRAIWLDHGRIVQDGPFEEVWSAYSGR